MYYFPRELLQNLNTLESHKSKVLNASSSPSSCCAVLFSCLVLLNLVYVILSRSKTSQTQSTFQDDDEVEVSRRRNKKIHQQAIKNTHTKLLQKPLFVSIFCCSFLPPDMPAMPVQYTSQVSKRLIKSFFLPCFSCIVSI